jgi:tRNA 5-methylaminomethyl-2-thiouridine biosynthesis bifunctional protein
MRVAIVGAGLAGCALAYVLKRAGATPVIYESGPEIAVGASGNELGLYNPRFTAEFGEEAQFYSAAFARAVDVFGNLKKIDWNPCGALHLINTEQKAKRFTQTVWNWPEPAMRLVDAQEAGEISGLGISYEALYLPQSGYVSPHKLCAAYAAGVEIHFNHPVEDLKSLEADAVAIANGMGAQKFLPDLPLKGVRGQVTSVKADDISGLLSTNVCYGGYVSPAVNGVHMVGSTFQRWLDHTDVLAEDDADNLAKLEAHVPVLRKKRVVGSRAGIRTTTPDHLPVIGEIERGLYVSTGHGSHGILSSLLAADFITDLIFGKSSALYEAVSKKIAPDRF